MTSVTFLLKDNPYGVDAGDTRISRLMIEIAADAYDVRVLALAQAGSTTVPPVPLTTIPSPPRSAARALLKNLTAPRRSALHRYFRVPELVRAIRDDRSDAVIAEHTYMAEPALAARLPQPDRRLLINTHALQSPVFAQRRSLPLRWIESRRTWHDELRCVRAASSTACLGEDDLERLQEAGANRLRRLDLLLPPAERPASPDRPRALFVGGRYRWPPNEYALERLLELWPEIEKAVPGAELIVAGRQAKGERPIDDPSVRVVGYVEDIDELLLSSSVLLAPVPIGGGVRVKVLDAARHGLPVVGSPQAIGTIGEYLPVTPAASDSEFSARAVALLSSADRARETGERLYEANRELWRTGFVHDQVLDWIAGA
jgi:glycosyltransferase involved in cell wall biosynthesis